MFSSSSKSRLPRLSLPKPSAAEKRSQVDHDHCDKKPPSIVIHGKSQRRTQYHLHGAEAEITAGKAPAFLGQTQYDRRIAANGYYHQSERQSGHRTQRQNQNQENSQESNVLGKQDLPSAHRQQTIACQPRG